MKPTIQAVTITVSDMAKSKQFYETVLGFEPDTYYEPTHWQCYCAEGRAYLGIVEVSNHKHVASSNIINFDIDNIEQYWNDVKDDVHIEAPLEKTPWGSLKFVICDPDGNRLGFVAKR